MALLRFYLNTIQSMIGPQSQIIAFGMTRHLSPRLREMFAKELGPVRVSPVRQKSVLFHIQPEIFEVDARALAPDRYLLPPELLPAAPDRELEIWSYPGVFSQKRLDLGTRLLLGNLPAVPPGATVVDLGCGAGVLGLAIALRSPDARLILVDDSFLAVRSAQETFARNGLKAEFYADDGLSGFEPGSVDVIVSNPPIHDGGAYEVEESVRLIRQARAALRKPGSIRLVSVHGADLRPHLQALFPKVSPVASTRRFAVWAASS
jgi:16S rRNA (guanine1207-N2)-methyltransferase